MLSARFEITFIQECARGLGQLPEKERIPLRDEMNYFFNGNELKSEQELLELFAASQQNKRNPFRTFIGGQFLSLVKRNDLFVIMARFGDPRAHNLSLVKIDDFDYINYEDNDGRSALDFVCANGSVRMA